MSVWRHAWVSAAVIALAGGCTSMPTGTTSGAARESSGGAPAGREAQEQRPQAQQPAVERRRGDFPKIETDEAGFTITEQIRISGDVREEYDAAVQLLRQERYDEGIAMLVAVTEKAPEITAPYIDLGIAYAAAGDVESAEAALETAARLSPGHPIAQNELGILYRRTGRFAAARESYERALATYPGFHFARRNLAVLCDLYLGDLDCALEHYQAYLDSVGDDDEVAIWIADIHNRLGR
ncbi:MAG: tetratricopeptide repeat protein [Gammaproteobacteria bacterium]|nr:tetratricopeptide repeat protein [Gammaproteobacteria bacterium]